MIVWFNCKITDIRPNPQPRYHLRNDNRFDIAKYSFASYAPLIPLVKKFIFNLEMADGHAAQQEEMESWLRSIFPDEKLSLHWHRCNNIAQWREVQTEMDTIGYDLIFPAGNEDHIFLDNTIDVFAQALDAVKQDVSTAATLMVSHWPESIRAVNHFNPGQTSPVPSYVVGNNDSIRVIKKEFFEWYLNQVTDPSMFIFRTEQWNRITLPTNKMYVPTKEQFRHFDGYTHVGINAEYAAPLEIPPGFFDSNITIRYGFDTRQDDCVNINPLTETLYAADGQGTDYKWTLHDIPLFWKPYIKEIIVAPDIEAHELEQARDINLLMTSRLTINWQHMGVVFGNANYPPVKWLNPHMQSITFTD